MYVYGYITCSIHILFLKCAFSGNINHVFFFVIPTTTVEIIKQ